jgi:predicted enzyme related to lactoylglutathione lyase
MLKNNKTFSSFSTNDLDTAKKFYGDTLGVDLTEEEMGFLRLHLGGGEVMVYPKGDEHKPANFTVLNFLVNDIEKTVDALHAKGITFEQYTQEDIKTDEKGISRGYGIGMAWFKDPAGNILAVMQLPEEK